MELLRSRRFRQDLLSHGNEHLQEVVLIDLDLLVERDCQCVLINESILVVLKDHLQDLLVNLDRFNLLLPLLLLRFHLVHKHFVDEVFLLVNELLQSFDEFGEELQLELARNLS